MDLVLAPRTSSRRRVARALEELEAARRSAAASHFQREMRRLTRTLAEVGGGRDRKKFYMYNLNDHRRGCYSAFWACSGARDRSIASSPIVTRNLNSEYAISHCDLVQSRLPLSSGTYLSRAHPKERVLGVELLELSRSRVGLSFGRGASFPSREAMKRIATWAIVSAVLGVFAAVPGCGGQDPGQPAAGSISVPPKDKDVSPFAIPKNAKSVRGQRK